CVCCVCECTKYTHDVLGFRNPEHGEGLTHSLIPLLRGERTNKFQRAIFPDMIHVSRVPPIQPAPNHILSLCALEGHAFDNLSCLFDNPSNFLELRSKPDSQRSNQP